MTENPFKNSPGALEGNLYLLEKMDYCDIVRFHSCDHYNAGKLIAQYLRFLMEREKSERLGFDISSLVATKIEPISESIKQEKETKNA